MQRAGHVGADNRAVLEELLELDAAEIARLEAAGVIGQLEPPRSDPSADGTTAALRIERGELSRVDGRHDDWKKARGA